MPENGAKIHLKDTNRLYLLYLPILYLRYFPTLGEIHLHLNCDRVLYKFVANTNQTSLISVDLWSLGIMVLHCLNGEVPFHGSDLGQYSSDREIDVAGHIPRALTGRHLSDVIKGLLRWTRVAALNCNFNILLIMYHFELFPQVRSRGPPWFWRVFTESVPQKCNLARHFRCHPVLHVPISVISIVNTQSWFL